MYGLNKILFLDDIKEKIKSSQELEIIVKSLNEKFCLLVGKVISSLINHGVKLEKAKLILTTLLHAEWPFPNESLNHYTEALRSSQSFFDLFFFLVTNDFIGPINYTLLKILSKIDEVNKKDNKYLEKQIDDYEKEYIKLFKNSFEDLIPLFERHHSVNAPIGLPHITLHLDKPWLVQCAYIFIKTLGKYNWYSYALLNELKRKSVVITFAILPCALSEAMRDLTNPNDLADLREQGITVMELPGMCHGLLHHTHLYRSLPVYTETEI